MAGTTTPLTFRTDVRGTLYLASAGLLILGLVFTGYFLTTPDAGFTGILTVTLGVFLLYVAWVNFWGTRAGYPHLTLIGHWLIVQSSGTQRRDLDLGALGAPEIVTLRARRSANRVYLGFPPLPGATHTPSRFTAPELQRFAETVLLNGYTGGDPARATAITDVINARRAEPKQDVAPPPRLDATLARIRFVATAGAFAALWCGLVWWRLLP
ncbi:MAG: hypothetical protein SFU85_09185 [Candidatus Methylacidiphilales bacterium]|nr:hypothetical protein [Candidatus Methylacidiphilales bacterium]